MENDFPMEELKPEDYGQVQILGFKDYYKNSFSELLESVCGQKKYSIFVDEYCLHYLKSLFTLEELEDMNFLTNYIIKDYKTYVIDKYIKDTSPKNIIKLKEQLLVFIVAPTQANIDQMTYAYVLTNSPSKNIDFNIIFIPGETPEIIKSMMRMEILNNYDIYSFKIDMFPIEPDLLSLQLEKSFREIYIDKNNSSILELVNAILKLEVAFGKINNKYIKGDYAKIVNDLLTLKEEEHNLKSKENILGMIVIDRSADYLTPLLSNFTYESIMDEMYGINNGFIRIKKSKVKRLFNDEWKKIKNDEYILYPLTSTINKFYSNLRCMHYLTANQKIIGIHNYHQKSLHTEVNDKSTKSINAAMTHLSNYINIKYDLIDSEAFINQIINDYGEDENMLLKQRELSLLKGIAQINSEQFYDDYITEKKDLDIILNMMIIESMTQNGLNNYSSIKRDILNVYGYQNIFLFRNLESLGWLKEKEKISKIFKSKHQTICEKLNLINFNFKINEPFSLEYVENGYCPISLKLIEKAGEGNWSEIRDSLQEIPGATIFPDNEEEVKNPSEQLNTIFVVFLGGVTYSEIQGIRYLNRKYKEIFDNSTDPNKTRKQFIIVTTQIINPKKVYNSLGMNFKSTYTIKQFNDDFEVKTEGQKKKKA